MTPAVRVHSGRRSAPTTGWNDDASSDEEDYDEEAENRRQFEIFAMKTRKLLDDHEDTMIMPRRQFVTYAEKCLAAYESMDISNTENQVRTV